ncbi:MerC domain-containing protein, partial [bacterium]
YGHDLFGESGEIASTLVGSSVLSFGHIKNQKLCKECCH